MIKCFICNTNHHNDYIKCNEIITLMIKNYINININNYYDELKELTKKK